MRQHSLKQQLFVWKDCALDPFNFGLTNHSIWCSSRFISRIEEPPLWFIMWPQVIFTVAVEYPLIQPKWRIMLHLPRMLACATTAMRAGCTSSASPFLPWFSSLSTFEEILSLEGFIFSHAMAVHLVANGNYLEGINQRWPTSQQTSG